MLLDEGYLTDEGFDPCEDYIGPFYYRASGESYDYAFLAENKHCNTHGTVHGGVLMTFADYCLCMEATNHYEQESCITVSFNADFVSAASQGDFIECRASLTRKTGSMAFVTGSVFVGKEIILTFSAVVKRIKESQ